MVGVNHRRGKSNKPDKAEKERKRFDRELRDCMHCKLFWGNNHRCGINKCCKSKPKIVQEKKIPEKCLECPYKQSDSYCFPCMKDILNGKRG